VPQHSVRRLPGSGQVQCTSWRNFAPFPKFDPQTVVFADPDAEVRLFFFGSTARTRSSKLRCAGVGERECTWGVRTREPDDLMLHLVEREGVTVVDVGEKLFVRLLVARGFGEVKAHESDEGVDVLDGHGLHVAELRSRGVDRGDVVKSRNHS
jgi:hypothetical protein